MAHAPISAATKQASGRSRWKIWSRRIAKLLILAAVVGFGIYYFTSSPVHVGVHVVQRGAITAEVMGTGTLEARTRATISPKISGRLADVLVDQGDRVEAGQLLARLDDDDLEQQVRIAEATIASSQASLGRFQADRDQAASVLEQASSEFRRTAQLASSRSVSQSDVDKAREALEVAKAGVARAEAGYIEAQQQVLLAQRTLAYHQARLADAKMFAPFDALVVERFRDAGSVAVPGTPVLSLISTEELWISAWVDETQMAKLAEAQAARVIFRSEPAKEYLGQVARLGRQADRETREFVVEVRVLELPKNWAVGQRAEVYIRVDRHDDVLLVPQAYLLDIEGRKGVYVHRDGRAHWQPITIGLSSRDVVEVTAGLRGGDELVIPLNRRLTTIDERRVIKR